MTITLYRADFIEIKDTIDGEYKSISSFDLMLKSQFNIKDTREMIK